MSSIFSRYSQGENRVTASILAVLRLLSLPAFDFLLSGLTNTNTGFHRISNQPSEGGEGIPDGEISANYKILIETKMPGATPDIDQLKRHLNRLSGQSAHEALIYLSADEEEPEEIKGLNDQLLWKSFADLRELLIELIKDETITLSSVESFLIDQLIAMLENETGLLPSQDKVLIVAARIAWPEYKEHGLYICQPNRPFRPVTHLAFYADGEIKPRIAKIKARYEAILMDQLPEEVSQAAKSLAEQKIARHEGDSSFYENEFQLFELSPYDDDDDETIHLQAAIPNDCISKATGKRVAFTQGQTYSSLEKLTVKDTTTSNLRET